MSLRPAHVLLLSVILIGLMSAWLYRDLRAASESPAADPLPSLAERVRERAHTMAGLTPCSPAHAAKFAALRAKLPAVRTSPDAVLALIAPTFSDFQWLVVEPQQLTRFTIPGETAFDGVLVDDDAPMAEALPDPALPAALQLRAHAALSRHVLHAGTAAATGGKDGTTYYFLAGSGACAWTWSPAQDSIAGELSKLVDNLAAIEPSITELDACLNRLDSFDRAP